MNTQYQKHSLYIAGVNYRNRRRAMHLRNRLIAFFTVLSIICTGLYIIISGTQI